MRRSLSSFVAMLCLLVLFISSAACMAVTLPENSTSMSAPQHSVSAGHTCCPVKAPADEHTSSTCCTVHHQPISAVSSVEVEQPVLLHTLTVAPLLAATTEKPLAIRKFATASLPLLIALRI